MPGLVPGLVHCPVLLSVECCVLYTYSIAAAWGQSGPSGGVLRADVPVGRRLADGSREEERVGVR